MSTKGQEYLAEEIGKAIDYCRDEFDMTYGEVLGTLHLVMAEMSAEAMESDRKDADEDED